MMETVDFLRFTKQYHTMAKEIDSTVYDKDRDMMRTLTRVVFSKWYSELVQENLKVVPDLDNSSNHANKFKNNYNDDDQNEVV